MTRKKKKIKKTNWIMLVLLVINIVALGIAVWALFFRTNKTVLAPDYAPQDEEPSAEAIPDDDTEKLEQPEGGGAVSLSYSREVSVDLSAGTAELYFANPGRSNQDIVLQVLVQNNVIIQSGTIKPGKQITEINLLENTGEMLEAGGYEGTFVVLYYDSDTREKAVVNTEIPVSITVRE